MLAPKVSGSAFDESRFKPIAELEQNSSMQDSKMQEISGSAYDESRFKPLADFNSLSSNQTPRDNIENMGPTLMLGDSNFIKKYGANSYAVVATLARMTGFKDSFSDTHRKEWEEANRIMEYNSDEAEMQRMLGPTMTGLHAAFVANVPMLKYFAMPSHKDVIDALPHDQQVKYFIIEGAGLGLMVFGGPLMKGLGKGIKFVGGKIDKYFVPDLLPFQKLDDLTQSGWVKFDYAQAFDKKLGKLKFANDEHIPVAELFTGNQDEMMKLIATKQARGEQLSKSLKRSLRIKNNTLELKPEFVKRFDKQRLAKENIINQLYAGTKDVHGLKSALGRKPNLDDLDAMVRMEASKFLDIDAARKISLRDLTEEQAANFMHSFISNPKPFIGTARVGYGLGWFTNLSVSKNVFGSGETIFGARTGIYNKITEGLGITRKWASDKLVRFMELMEEQELGKLSYTTFGMPKFDKNFAEKSMNTAYKHIIDLDTMTQQAVEFVKANPIQGAGMQQQVRLQIQAKAAKLASKDPVASKIVTAWNKMSDELYAEGSIFEMQKLLQAPELTRLGKRQVKGVLDTFETEMKSIFTDRNNTNYAQRFARLNTALNNVKAKLKPLAVMDKDKLRHDWFKANGNDLTSILDDLDIKLSRKTDATPKGTWIDYLDNYAARFKGEENELADKWFGQMYQGKSSPIYARMRKEAEYIPTNDFNSMLVSRVNGQAKHMFLHDSISEAIGHAKKLPHKWQDYTEWFIGRALGIHGPGDDALTYMLEKSIGRLEQVFGYEGKWTIKRTQQLGQAIRDVQHVAALGFKPFAALRDLIQLPLTVPAELGGKSGLDYMLKGIAKVSNPEARAYLQKIEAITEYLPEISNAIKPMSFSKWDTVKDLGMWLYRGSNRFCRYSAGGAAMSKWDDVAKQYLRKPVKAANATGAKYVFNKATKEYDKAIPAWHGRITESQAEEMIIKLGADGRYAWDRLLLKDLLKKGQFEEAKAYFVKDFVDQTQYLFGTLESPKAFSSFGETGKSLALFQHWWTSYGALVSKWVTHGTAGTRADKMLNWLYMSALSMAGMERIWGQDMARENVLLGPRPASYQDVISPPFIDLVDKGLKSALGVGDLLLGGDPKEAERNVMRWLSGTWMLVPGGSQLKSSIGSTMDDGLEGFLKSLYGGDKKKNDDYFFDFEKLQR